MTSGTNISHPRCQCLFGGFFGIDYLRKTTWFGDKSSPLQTRIVLQVVEGWKLQHICSYTMTYSALFGTMYGAGYIFLRCPLAISDNILFNSLHWRGCLDSLTFMKVIWFASVWVIWKKGTTMCSKIQSLSLRSLLNRSN